MTRTNSPRLHPGKTATTAVGVIRLAMATLIAVAIIATFLDTASRAVINPFNFFGYFTMQSNIIFAVVLTVSGILLLRRQAQGPRLSLVRGFATTYILMVGIVYNTLLTGLEGGVALEWANWSLHVASPVFALLDWLFISDRHSLTWRAFAGVLIYPSVWAVVVLIRGATDGWVPYPFLDPARGYGTVALYVLVILVASVLVGAVVFLLSRVSLSRMTRPTA